MLAPAFAAALSLCALFAGDASARHDAGARHAELIRRLVERADPAAIEYVVKSVRSGMPPRSLEAFLEGAQQAPHADYVPLLRRLTRYRKERIRALALVALAAFDDDHGAEAALLAMEDPSLDVRLLGVQLAERHTAPHVEEAMLLLLDRDARVAKIVGRSSSTSTQGL